MMPALGSDIEKVTAWRVSTGINCISNNCISYLVIAQFEYSKGQGAFQPMHVGLLNKTMAAFVNEPWVSLQKMQAPGIQSKYSRHERRALHLAQFEDAEYQVWSFRCEPTVLRSSPYS